jgi:hypothetical protein
MASPRFASNRRLQNAASNAPPLVRGTDDVAVHLLQMALLDLGFKLPMSTGGRRSPDGIFGAETETAIKAFQKKQNLDPDGRVGRETMAAFDKLFPSHTHRVRLHFRSLALTSVPFNRLLDNAVAVYSQYGINVEFGSGESLLLTPEQQDKFAQIDQACDWDLESGEFEQLQSLGTRVPHTDVLVYFVVTFMEGNLLGCGGHAKDRPACTLAQRCNGFDPAHELGHVLLGSSFNPVHSDDTRNLMFKFSTSNTDIRVLTDSQITQMRKSPVCQRV